MMTDIMVTGREARGGKPALYEDGEVGEEVGEMKRGCSDDGAAVRL